MLKIFIFVVLFLILYQFINTIVEGLEGESSEDSSSSSGNVDNSSSNNNNCAMSLTDRNVFLLNDRVNALQIQYTDLSGNMAILNRQLEDLMKQNENAATEMVGNEPLDISTGGNDMPQEVSGDIGGEGDEVQQEQEPTTPV
jgi:hypothetical protein